MSGHTNTPTLEKLLDNNSAKNKIVVHNPEEAMIAKNSEILIPNPKTPFTL
jgi:hypothetical protein